MNLHVATPRMQNYITMVSQKSWKPILELTTKLTGVGIATQVHSKRTLTNCPFLALHCNTCELLAIECNEGGVLRLVITFFCKHTQKILWDVFLWVNLKNRPSPTQFRNLLENGRVFHLKKLGITPNSLGCPTRFSKVSLPFRTNAS